MMELYDKKKLRVLILLIILLCKIAVKYFKNSKKRYQVQYRVSGMLKY